MELQSVEGPDHPIVLAGVCLGLEGEAERAAALVPELAPSAVALGLDPALVAHVDTLGDDALWSVEDQAYSRGLSRWGEVELPGDVFAQVVAAAGAIGVRVEGVDLQELDYVDRYTSDVGIADLVRRGLRARRMRKRPPKAPGPEAFCRAFDAKLNRGPFRDLEGARERHMAERVAALSEKGPVLVVLEVQRVDGVTGALQALLGPHARVRRT